MAEESFNKSYMHIYNYAPAKVKSQCEVAFMSHTLCMHSRAHTHTERRNQWQDVLSDDQDSGCTGIVNVRIWNQHQTTGSQSCNSYQKTVRLKKKKNRPAAGTHWSNDLNIMVKKQEIIVCFSLFLTLSLACSYSPLTMVTNGFLFILLIALSPANRNDYHQWSSRMFYRRRRRKYDNGKIKEQQTTCISFTKQIKTQ